MFGSATVDEESVASGFSTAVAIEWMPATGVTYCCETFHNRILKIESDGKAVPFVGEKYGYRDGPLDVALLAAPSGVAVEATGALLISDTSNHVLRRVHLGVVT